MHLGKFAQFFAPPIADIYVPPTDSSMHVDDCPLMRGEVVATLTNHKMSGDIRLTQQPHSPSIHRIVRDVSANAIPPDTPQPSAATLSNQTAWALMIVFHCIRFRRQRLR